MITDVTNLPEHLNAACIFIDDNVKDGKGGNIAIYYEEKKVTYNEIYKMVNQTGNALKNIGVDMEERVMLLLHDTPEYVAAFFGAMKIGAVPIPTNTMLKPKEYEYLLNDSRSKTLIIQDVLLKNLEEIKGNLKYLKNIIVVGNKDGKYLSFSKIISNADDNLTPAETSKDDAAFWLYSSGSTGFPKGAVHLHHDMVYNSDFYAKRVLNINEKDIFFSAAKIFFAYGLGNNIYFPFRVGASVVLYPDKPTSSIVFDVIKKYNPDLFFGVPALYAKMLQYMESNEVETDSLRLCISAGESLPADIYKRWKDNTGLEILDGIGSTEILHIFISNRRGKVKPGSTGKVVDGYKAKIVNENGIEVKIGEVGDLLISGDSNSPYYWNKHEKTKKTMLGEWINTGDKYYKDEDEYLWYCGRSDDMMKVNGIWVSPAEVENTLISHKTVLECAVVGTMDKNNLLKPKAYIVLNDGFKGTDELKDELKKFVREKLASHKFPRWIDFVDVLPRTATGKIQRFKLRG